MLLRTSPRPDAVHQHSVAVIRAWARRRRVAIGRPGRSSGGLQRRIHLGPSWLGTISTEASAAGEHIPRDAAQHDFDEGAATSRSEHDEVRASLRGEGDDLGGRIPAAHRGVRSPSRSANSSRRLVRGTLSGLVASFRSCAKAFTACRWNIGAIPLVHGRTASATLTTPIGRRSNIGQLTSMSSAARADGESSVASTSWLTVVACATRTGHGAWSTTSADTEPRRSEAIVP